MMIDILLSMSEIQIFSEIIFSNKNFDSRVAYGHFIQRNATNISKWGLKVPKLLILPH